MALHLQSLANLASTYSNQGRWKGAEELEVQVMETRKRVIGAEHPDMLINMDNLASTYRNQDRWKEAEELFVQVMETCLRVLGAEHPDTLASMANLALTFGNQGQWKEAKELEVQVMETRKRVLSAEHPDTLTSMNNFAFTWKAQGRDRKAMDLLSKCAQLLSYSVISVIWGLKLSSISSDWRAFGEASGRTSDQQVIAGGIAIQIPAYRWCRQKSTKEKPSMTNSV